MLTQIQMYDQLDPATKELKQTIRRIYVEAGMTASKRALARMVAEGDVPDPTKACPYVGSGPYGRFSAYIMLSRLGNTMAVVEFCPEAGNRFLPHWAKVELRGPYFQKDLAYLRQRILHLMGKARMPVRNSWENIDPWS